MEKILNYCDYQVQEGTCVEEFAISLHFFKKNDSSEQKECQ